MNTNTPENGNFCISHAYYSFGYPHGCDKLNHNYVYFTYKKKKNNVLIYSISFNNRPELF